MSSVKNIFSSIQYFFNEKKGLFVFSILIYIVLSILIISSRIPFFDEINAWNIAANCSFLELFDVSRHEGHFVLWYLLIKPFASKDIGFPISIFAVNWIFAFLAVLILWFKSPFNSLIKMFITFSLPILMFSVYARCYAIGLFFLFIICSIYPIRIKHPIIYPVLVILLANTSVMGTIAGFVFGLMYLYDFFVLKMHNKISIKHIIQALCIFLFGAILILLQIGNYSVPEYSTLSYRLYKFNDFFSFWPNLFKNISMVAFFILILTGFKFFIKDKLPYICTCVLALYVLVFIFNIFNVDLFR